jgi:TolA-binding protein
MPNLYTAYPQLIPILAITLTLLNSIGLWAVYKALQNKYLRDFPGRSKITELEIEVSDFNGTVADLIDRFNRFQKKENMRAVRLEQAQQQDVLAQAREIAAQADAQEASGPVNSKLELYRKRGH